MKYGAPQLQHSLDDGVLHLLFAGKLCSAFVVRFNELRKLVHKAFQLIAVLALCCAKNHFPIQVCQNVPGKYIRHPYLVALNLFVLSFLFQDFLQLTEFLVLPFPVINHDVLSALIGLADINYQPFLI